MRYVFFGTPEFAAIILEKLIQGGFIPDAVVCNPDRPVGRKKVITPPPVKSLILKHGTLNIKILQPEKLDKNFVFEVSGFMPDVFVVAAYGKILPKEILEIPRLGTIGVHPSLLPKYRGSSPIQSAILNGEEKTGVTLYLLDEKMDHGLILATGNWQLTAGINYETLLKELAELGGDLLIKTLPKFLNGEIKPIPQNEAEATYTKKFTSEDAFVDEKILKNALDGKNPEAAIGIERKTRALNPEPGVWTYMRMRALQHSHILQNVRMSFFDKPDRRVKLLAAEIRDDKLILKKIQIEGGKPKLADSSQ